MKKRAWVPVLMTVLLSIAVVFTGCNKNETEQTPEPTPEPAAVRLDTNSIELDVYETRRLTATVTGTEAAVIWSSSDGEVATVQDGLVTAVSEGEATVTASAGDARAVCVVTVYNSNTAPVLQIDRNSVYVEKGKSQSVTVQTLWKGNPIDETVDYTWQADNDYSGIVSIAKNGDTFEFTGIEYGTVDLTVSATVRGVLLAGNIRVRVYNADIAFKVEGLTAVEGGYTADLAKLAYEEHVTEKSFTVTVTEKGTTVPDASIEWTIEDPSVVTLSDGTLTAGAEGSTRVIGTYQNNDVVIYVTTYRTPIATEEVYLETYKLAPKVKGIPTTDGQTDTLTFTSEFEGNVTSVMLGGVDIFKSYDKASKTLHIDTDALPTETNAMGEAEFVVNTDVAVYTPSRAQVVTMAIRNTDDFNKMGEVAANQTADWTNDSSGTAKPYHWDGYFVLTNDITYSGTYTSFCSWATLGGIEVHNPDATTEGWNSGKANGFQGVFDGNGYTVTGLELANSDQNNAGGIFGILAQGSIIRNVSFVDFEHTVGSGYLCSSGIGTIENVYLRCLEQSGGRDNDDKNGLLYASDVEVGAVVKNVFIETVLASDTDNYAIGSVREGYGIYKGVYAVGSTHATRLLAEGNGTKNVLGAYSNYAELAAADIDFSSWENDFWRIVNGFPYPKNLELPEVSTEATYDEYMPLGGECAVSVDKRAVIELSDDAIQAGVTLNGNTIVAPDTLTSGSTIGFTVRSVFDNNSTNSYSVTIVTNQTDALTDRQRVVACGTDKNTFTVDLSSLGSVADTEVYMVSLDGAVFTTKNWDASAKTLTLDRATLLKYWGECDVTAVFAHGSGDTYDKFITVTIPLTIVTQVISTPDDFKNWNKVANNVAGGGIGQYAGYFELGDNIEYEGVYPTFWTWTEGRDDWSDADKYGFSGMFDGCGYTVKGLTLESGNNCSIFGVLKAGTVIKNIAFTDYTGGKNSAGLCISSKGTIENIYIECIAHDGGSSENQRGSFFGLWRAYPEVKVRHCLVEVKFSGANDLPYMLAIGNVYEGTGSLDGVYVIGMTDNLVNITNTQSGTQNVYGGYADYAAFVAGDINCTDWSTDFWAVSDGGIPYPSRLKQEVLITNTETTLATGTQLQIVADGVRKTYAVDETAADAGVTISETGMLTIPESIESAMPVTVTVGTYNDPSDKDTKTFYVMPTTRITVDGRQDVYYYDWSNGSDTTFLIDLSAYSDQIQGTLVSVSIDGAAFATKNYSSNKLELDRNTLKLHYGEQNVVAQFDRYDDADENVIGTTIVTIPVLSITAVISNQWQFKQWDDVANSVAGNQHGQYAGYFVLGGNFTYNASEAGDYEAFWNWSIATNNGANSVDYLDAKTYGFTGTFDGRGYTIDGLKLQGWNNASIFGLLKEGAVIKNIAFTSFTGDSAAAGLCLASCGTIENIYIECTRYSVGDVNGNSSFFGLWRAYPEAQVRHCLVKVAFEGADDLSYMRAIGNVYEGNLDGVYIIGMTKNLVDDESVSNVYGGYADDEAFKAAVSTDDLASWEGDFWEIVDGVPTKKSTT